MKEPTVIKIKNISIKLFIAITSILILCFFIPFLIDKYSEYNESFAISNMAIKLASNMSINEKMIFSISMGLLQLFSISSFFYIYWKFIELLFNEIDLWSEKKIKSFLVRSFINEKTVYFEKHRISKNNNWVLNMKDESFELLDKKLNILEFIKIDNIVLNSLNFKVL